MSIDPGRLMLTPEQRADDAVPDPVQEALAVHLYESDWESAFNDGDDVQWRHNYADRDHYRDLARAALEFVTSTATQTTDIGDVIDQALEDAIGETP